MNFSIVFSEKALKQLKKIDKHKALFITGWLRKNIEGCVDPGQHGKGLAANKSDQWRYRVGEYRIITEICPQMPKPRKNILNLYYMLPINFQEPQIPRQPHTVEAVLFL